MQPLGTWERRLLVAAALLALGSVAGGFLIAVDRPSFDHATGSWFVIAHDILEGTFYRPLVGELGYGGTRYFPVYPVLLAGLAALGVGYIPGSLLINAVACALIVAGTYRTLRALGIDAFVAGIFAAFSTASYGALITLTSLRGDLLPVAFAIWGVNWAVRAADDDRLRFPALAGAAFSLAFAAKLSALFWPLGCVLALAVQGRRKTALQLVAALAVGTAAMLAIVQFASDGRFLEQLAVTMGGGKGLGRMLRGPFVFERYLRGSDPLGYLAVLAAIVLLLTAGKHRRTGFPAYVFNAVLVMSFLIFGSHGTIQNHLADIHVAAILVLAPNLYRLRTNANVLPTIMLIYAGWLGIVYATEYSMWSDDFTRSRAVRWLEKRPGIALSEHPAVPLLAGKHPYLADGFMLRVVREREPAVDERLRREIVERRYDTIVLTHDEDYWYKDVHFGEGFLPLLKEHYVERHRIGQYRFYVPRGTQGLE